MIKHHKLWMNAIFARQTNQHHEFKGDREKERAKKPLAFNKCFTDSTYFDHLLSR